ncbi:MAG: hypothetical protein KBT04_04115 [Bacteroidales bacterium]|nr:hypothetical protein [Candidatus Colimorpha onthohippi]
MKQHRLIITCIILATLLVTACKKKVDDMDFSGTIVGCVECTGSGTGVTISEMDWGYLVQLDKPTNVGSTYGEYSNVVLLYGTKTLFKEEESISGKLYFDDDYAGSYCFYHFDDHNIPQAVCSELD